MPRYYLHLHECGTILRDEKGSDYGNLEEARLVAIDAARDVMSHEVKQGALCLSCCIVVEDAEREVVLRVPFRDAIVLSGL